MAIENGQADEPSEPTFHPSSTSAIGPAARTSRPSEYYRRHTISSASTNAVLVNTSVVNAGLSSDSFLISPSPGSSMVGFDTTDTRLGTPIPTRTTVPGESGRIPVSELTKPRKKSVFQMFRCRRDDLGYLSK